MHKLLSLLALSIFIISCKQSSAPDVSDIHADFEIIRTDVELKNVHSKASLDSIYQKHPAFYSLFFNEITGMNTSKNPDTMYADLQEFMSDSMIISTYNLTDRKYNSLQDLHKDLESLFKYLQYYFPNRFEVPNIYTLISGFGYQTFIFEDEKQRDAIGIGLDMFLSPEIPYKKIFPDNTNFSDYLTRSWSKPFIVKKVADLYLEEINGESPGHRLLDYMIHNGKGLYITSLLLPEKNDTIIHEYTKEQMDWCYANELQMWSFFLDQKLFYESNFKKIGKYIFPAPKSPDMPDAAPGRTGNFIGYQIVKAYMNRYPETTIEELIRMTDSQQFLEKSKYKPQKK